MGFRAGLDRCGKSHPPPGFDCRTVQLVASFYTDYAIPTPRVEKTELYVRPDTAHSCGRDSRHTRGLKALLHLQVNTFLGTSAPSENNGIFVKVS